MGDIKRMTSLQDFQNTKITLSDICQKGKTIIANIADEKGRPTNIVLSKDCTLNTPWHVSSYDGGSRCSFDIVMTEVMQTMVTNIDKEVLDWTSNDTARYFKSPPKDIPSWYKSVNKEASKEGYSDTLRTTCTIIGEMASFKCWYGDRSAISTGDIKNINWPPSTFACEVALKGVYFQANSFGPMLEVTDVMITPEDQSCPFDEIDE
ncbi:hypothetical protein N9L68_06290 [bacterium]|nr:hypothetical protein [bacterium]